MDHVLKNIHPNIAEAFEFLHTEIETLKDNFEALRLQVVYDATPEMPIEEIPAPVVAAPEHALVVDVPQVGEKPEPLPDEILP
ncbi:MAG: hypothetical protein ACREBQ_05950 [Nitrososphaerales archaeon]